MSSISCHLLPSGLQGAPRNLGENNERISQSSRTPPPLVTPRAAPSYANINVKKNRKVRFYCFYFNFYKVTVEHDHMVYYTERLVDWESLVVEKLVMFILEGFHLMLVVVMVNIIVPPRARQSGLVSLV